MVDIGTGAARSASRKPAAPILTIRFRPPSAGRSASTALASGSSISGTTTSAVASATRP